MAVRSPKNDRDVEVYAMALWDLLKALEIEGGHSKNYDPLTLERKVDSLRGYSYVFNLYDGGRTHDLTGKTRSQICKILLEETVQNIREGVSLNVIDGCWKEENDAK